MGNELIGEHRGVDFDFDEIDGHGWDFSEDSSAERVCEGEVDVVEREVDAVGGNLAPLISLSITDPKRVAYIANCYSRSHLINVHSVVVHGEGCAMAQACSRPSLYKKSIDTRNFHVGLGAITIRSQFCVVVSKDRGVIML